MRKIQGSLLEVSRSLLPAFDVDGGSGQKDAIFSGERLVTFFGFISFSRHRRLEQKVEEGEQEDDDHFNDHVDADEHHVVVVVRLIKMDYLVVVEVVAEERSVHFRH